MAQPKVSIVMASYNHEKYVGKAIESVLSQTYTDWEFIIYDDCSTDASAEIIKSYNDSRIRFYQGEKNKGAVSAFNELLKLAQGEYVAILGSDDMWKADKLEEQIGFLENNKEIAVCFSLASFIDEDGNAYSENSCDFEITVFNQENRSRGKHVRSFFERGNYLCHPSSVVRRNVIEQVGGFDKRFRQLHDFYYWTRIVQKNNFFIIQKPLVLYRRKRNDNDSISASNVKNIIRDINESEIIIYEMIKELDKATFKEAFSDCMIKNEPNDYELICEKYFVLLDWKKAGVNNRTVAMRYLGDYLNDEKIWQCLNDEYHYTINDFYEEMATVHQTYPMVCYPEYDAILENYRIRCEKAETEIEAIHNTMSWKITKPLRMIRKFERKHEH